jgi:transcriptional regulator with XRE-family HTH domain
VTNYLSPERRSALLAALANGDVVAAARRLGVNLNVAYAWDSRRLRGVCICEAPLHDGQCDGRSNSVMMDTILKARVEENLSRAELVARFPGATPKIVTRATAGHPYRGRRSPKTKDYTPAELDALQRLYPRAPWQEIFAALPGRPFLGLQRKASSLGIKRIGSRLPTKQISPELAILRARRHELNLTVARVAELVGLKRGTMARYESGWDRPAPARLAAWKKALGLDDDHRYVQPPSRPLPAPKPKPLQAPPVAVKPAPLVTVPKSVPLPQQPSNAPAGPFSMFSGLPRRGPRPPPAPGKPIEIDYARGAQSYMGSSMAQ